jgi:phosphohistidine swiveling domain-containing protein
MNELNYINKIKFKLFLRRELSLLATSVVILGYTKELKKAINFSFENICYLSNGEITSSLRNEAELKQYSETVSEIIENNRSKCNVLLNKGIKLNNAVWRLIKAKNNYHSYSNQELSRETNKLLNIYIKLFVFATIIPYEAGLAFNNLKGKNKISQLRLVSLYSAFEEKVLGNLFKEAAKRQKIKNYRLLFNLEYYEVSKFILGNITITEPELKARAKFINLLTPKIRFIKFGENNYQKYSKVLLPAITKKLKVISGKTAYPGKVKGRVRILLSRQDISKFVKGEILVTVSSNPEFMSAIKKSKAIIADEGGIACHAAIISREFKIPCIIGTKIATQILKNGDLVEADADKGIVRILESKI